MERNKLINLAKTLGFADIEDILDEDLSRLIVGNKLSEFQALRLEISGDKKLKLVKFLKQLKNNPVMLSSGQEKPALFKRSLPSVPNKPKLPERLLGASSRTFLKPPKQLPPSDKEVEQEDYYEDIDKKRSSLYDSEGYLSPSAVLPPHKQPAAHTVNLALSTGSLPLPPRKSSIKQVGSQSRLEHLQTRSPSFKIKNIFSKKPTIEPDIPHAEPPPPPVNFRNRPLPTKPLPKLEIQELPEYFNQTEKPIEEIPDNPDYANYQDEVKSEQSSSTSEDLFYRNYPDQNQEKFSSLEKQLSQQLAKFKMQKPKPYNFNNERFFRNTDRRGAKSLLKDLPDGTFLFRPSTNYTISLTIKLGNVFFNVGIIRDTNDSFKIATEDVNFTFKTLSELADHFTRSHLCLRKDNKEYKIYLNPALPDNLF